MKRGPRVQDHHAIVNIPLVVAVGFKREVPFTQQPDQLAPVLGSETREQALLVKKMLRDNLIQEVDAFVGNRHERRTSVICIGLAHYEPLAFHGIDAHAHAAGCAQQIGHQFPLRETVG